MYSPYIGSWRLSINVVVVKWNQVKYIELKVQSAYFKKKKKKKRNKTSKIQVILINM